jgi:2-phospho-L-lactate guanylyltransferase (CobY/MobA/RfbA family)
VVTIVIPFAGAEGKTRLQAPVEVRNALAAAMLADVEAACREIGETLVADQPGGQGAAVAGALAGVTGPIAVVNADLPCATPADIRRLVDSAPALVSAADGTTNALSLRAAEDFAPLYGPGSAVRFGAHTSAGLLDLPNLADDVDTMDDLDRLEHRLGPHTRAALALLHGSAV